jgi:hypothetical protein
MVTAAPASRPVPLQPESLTFVEPTPSKPVILRWTESEGAAGYLMTVQPFADTDTDLMAHGYTTEERLRCDGDALLELGQPSRGLSQQTTCELRLPQILDEGIYRWQVQPLDLTGAARGAPSDWGFFVVARR